MQAFIQVATDSPNPQELIEKLKGYPEILRLYVLFGKWDVVAIADLPDSEALGKFIIDKIRTIPGVRDTATQIVAKEYAK